MSTKKETYRIARNKKGQFDPKGFVKKEDAIDAETQRYINQALTRHVEKLYASEKRMKLAIFALLTFDVVYTYVYVNFTRQIVSYLGGL